MTLSVLNLVTKRNARFYQQQVDALAAMGVESTTLAVPGRDYDQASVESRSMLDYLKFHPSVLRHSFGDYDLVHANYGLTAPSGLAQPNLPVVLSLWGSDLMGKYGRVTKWCAGHCDAVVVMSEEMATQLGHPCYVIPHGVDLGKFAPAPQPAARDAVGWRQDAYHVLFPYATRRAVKDFPRAERVVAAAAERLGRPVEVQTVYGEPHDAMPTYMNAADALLLTSQREGSPNSVKESMACNLPVVATDVGDVGDRLEDVANSHVADTDEGLVDALAAVLAAGERSNGREHVRDVSLERMGERLRCVYEAVLEGDA